MFPGTGKNQSGDVCDSFRLIKSINSTDKIGSSVWDVAAKRHIVRKVNIMGFLEASE